MISAPLALGNAAKHYCLDLIDRAAESRNGRLTILDLGCGTGANFVSLLDKYPAIAYVGVEPSSKACAAARERLKGRNVEIRNELAYDVRVQPADIVVSFSVLEHVYQRRKYLECAKSNLAPHGVVFLNYDAGHFVRPKPSFRRGSDRWDNFFGPLLARLGEEGTYQSFVREAEFRSLVDVVGLKVVDAKMFNTDLKSAYKLVPEECRPEFMRRWLDMELYLNSMGIVYEDRMAKTLGTRNFILTHPDSASSLAMEMLA